MGEKTLSELKDYPFREGDVREKEIQRRIKAMSDLWAKWCTREEYVYGENIPSEIQKAYEEKLADLQAELEYQKKGVSREKIKASLKELEQI